MTSGTGTCTVKYDQAGDANYNAATQVTESVTAQKAGQTITFAPLPDRTYGDPDFTVSATASSGLAVSFGATGQCTVTGATVHLTGPGTCTITASQAGDTNYTAATDVSRTFQINAPRRECRGDDRRHCHLRAFAAGTAPALDRQLHRQEGHHHKCHPQPGRLLGQGHRAGGPERFRSTRRSRRATSDEAALGTGSNVFNSACAKGKHPTFTCGRRWRDGEFNATAAGTYLIGIHYTNARQDADGAGPGNGPLPVLDRRGLGLDKRLDLMQQVPAAPAASVRSAVPRPQALVPTIGVAPEPFSSGATPARPLPGSARRGSRARRRPASSASVRREVRVRDREHAHPCGLCGEDAVVRVLDGRRMGRGRRSSRRAASR